MALESVFGICTTKSCLVFVNVIRFGNKLFADVMRSGEEGQGSGPDLIQLCLNEKKTFGENADR